MSTLTASHGLTLSERGLKLIKAFEGYRPVDRTLVGGQRVVGYGHRLYDDVPHRLSKSQAEKVLKLDLEPYEDMINENVHAPLSQGQFDALVSFAFNIGPKAFLQSETLQALNNGRPLDAANSLDVWRKSRVNGKVYVIDALMRRRTAEKALFLRTDKTPHPSPTVDLPPIKDTGVSEVSDATLTYGEAQVAAEEVWEDKSSEVAADEDIVRDDRLESSNILLQEGIVAQAPIETFEATDTPYIEETFNDDDNEQLELVENDVVEEDILEQGPDFTVADVTELDVEEPQAKQSFDDVLDLDDVLELSAIDELTVGDSLDVIQDIEAPIVEPHTDYDLSTNEISLPTEPVPAVTSSIAEAAADISDRLDALIENVRDGDSTSHQLWPEASASDEALNNTMETKTSPSALRAKSEAILKAESIVEPDVDLSAGNTRTHDIIIDNLAEDDAMRVGGKSGFNHLDIAKDNVQKDVVDNSSSLGLWSILMFGVLILALAVLSDLTGAHSQMGSWGPLIVLSGFTIGSLMILGALYYLIRRAFRQGFTA